MKQYDHQSKAGNEGDVVKHPALTAALKGLLTEHEGVFRYADAFAGRWESELSQDGGWRRGIEKFASRRQSGNPDIEGWRRQWSAAAGTSYPGSTQLAHRILCDRGNYDIRAFEILEAYAASLGANLRDTAVFTRSATPADWKGWPPDLLFIDPPGLRSERKPDYPTLESLLRLAEGGAEGVANVLMWLPMVGERASSRTDSPLGASVFATRNECIRAGFKVLAVRWCEDGLMPGCLLAYRFESPKVARRVAAAAMDVVRTMGQDWRMV